MDGQDDPTIPPEDQEWAMNKMIEVHYRKLFHLTKAEMQQETMEDVMTNLQIERLLNKRQEFEEKAAKMRADRAGK